MDDIDRITCNIPRMQSYDSQNFSNGSEILFVSIFIRISAISSKNATLQPSISADLVPVPPTPFTWKW